MSTHLHGAGPVPKAAQTMLVFYTKGKEITLEKGIRLITFAGNSGNSQEEEILALGKCLH